MKTTTLLFLIFLSASLYANDSLKVKNHQGLVFAQFGGIPSIYIIGYGHEFRKNKHFSWGVLTGFGADFIRFQPYYNMETELKLRGQYNFNQRHGLILEIGSQYIFNPWYMSNSDKYFPDCSKQRCPNALFNHFADIGYRYNFQNGLSLLGQLYYYYYDGWRNKFPWPGIEVNYSFGNKGSK